MRNNINDDVALYMLDKLDDENLINQIYQLNQENTPEVGSLKSPDDLKYLLKICSDSFYIQSNGKLIGFIICLFEDTDYQSPNYKFFKQNQKNFLYIDRIAIKEKYRKRGYGSLIYEELFKVSKKRGIPICCEVNLVPKNEPSLRFHKKNGFLQIGQQAYEKNTVAFFLRRNI